MNEYNERTLKNVLEDYREEQDKEFLKEIEEAANDPLYQNREGEAEAFAKKHNIAKKKETKKIFFRVASILLIFVIGLSIIPITVEGRKSYLAELIINYINSEFLAFDSDAEDNLLLSYEGNYVPTWIPDGYEVETVTNKKDKKEITFINTNKSIITYRELPSNFKLNIDNENYDNIKNIEINGYEAIWVEKDGLQQLVLLMSDVVLYVTSDDLNIDLIGFAKKIEKR